MFAPPLFVAGSLGHLDDGEQLFISFGPAHLAHYWEPSAQLMAVARMLLVTACHKLKRKKRKLGADHF
jgi:hypothetical protein